MDRVLAAACTLFPNGHVTETHPIDVVGEITVPDDASGLGRAADQAAADYRHGGAHIAALHDLINQTVSAADAEARHGGTWAAAIRDTACAQTSGIAPSIGAPEGLGQPVSLWSNGWPAMRHHIADTRKQLADAAQRIARYTSELDAVIASEQR
jgi:hypothetical protein